MQQRNYDFVRGMMLCLLFICLSGCGGDGKYPVSGVVTWEGDPIPGEQNGHITFTPADATVAPDAGKIAADGKFSFRASPGDKRVEILISRPIGKVIESMGGRKHEQYIPTRYNEESELTATVESKSNSFNFDLVSKKGDKKAGM
jgi:hypothetical protein